MLDESEEIGAKRRLLSKSPPGLDQSLLSRVAWSDLRFALAIVTEEVSDGRIEGGGDPSEPVEGNPAASFLEVREGTW
jgi:hypothetical protein